MNVHRLLVCMARALIALMGTHAPAQRNTQEQIVTSMLENVTDIRAKMGRLVSN